MGKFTAMRTTRSNLWEEWTFLAEDGQTYLVTTHTEYYPEIDYHEFQIEDILDEAGNDLDPDDYDRVRDELWDIEWEVEAPEEEEVKT